MDEQSCATCYPILLVHGTGFRDWKRLSYWGRIPEVLRREGRRSTLAVRTAGPRGRVYGGTGAISALWRIGHYRI